MFWPREVIKSRPPECAMRFFVSARGRLSRLIPITTVMTLSASNRRSLGRVYNHSTISRVTPGHVSGDIRVYSRRLSYNFSNRFLGVDCQSSRRTLHSRTRIQNPAKRLAMSAPPQVSQLAQVPLSYHSFNVSHGRKYLSQVPNLFSRPISLHRSGIEPRLERYRHI
ncbi:hypothetical protein BS47DRAFT_275855 [Hydnum rufescens UP504]|uniref:Uncharacterized protein n=1 Tax=Hydnum rufescens UP504 TaxID=1448309 RepID=A0A9P6DNA2_9AGAM|nr:hypothetical protein BS47DRAFT_275855 [Hydnum rufescens UP504]